ncbi:hypothetical protein WNZ14_22495 [Hoeflea sp. AS60]|uniref:hypothetical protein n=1 Tax=Hoeflea sp. AS60 TaxID=3135780 RepID=UPI00317A9705
MEAYLVWEPGSVLEAAWDLTYLKVNYLGQKIEIGDSANLKIPVCKSGEWRNEINATAALMVPVQGDRIFALTVGGMAARPGSLSFGGGSCSFCLAPQARAVRQSCRIVSGANLRFLQRNIRDRVQPEPVLSNGSGVGFLACVNKHGSTPGVIPKCN